MIAANRAKREAKKTENAGPTSDPYLATPSSVPKPARSLSHVLRAVEEQDAKNELARRAAHAGEPLEQLSERTFMRGVIGAMPPSSVPVFSRPLLPPPSSGVARYERAIEAGALPVSSRNPESYARAGAYEGPALARESAGAPRHISSAPIASVHMPDTERAPSRTSTRTPSRAADTERTPSQKSERAPTLRSQQTPSRAPVPVRAREETPTPKGTIQECTDNAVRAALARHPGNKAAAARELGMTREGLYGILRRMGWQSDPVARDVHRAAGEAGAAARWS